MFSASCGIMDTKSFFAFINTYATGYISFLFALLFFLLVLGAVLDIFSAIVLVDPLILTVAAQYNMHPVHLGIVFLAAMGLGYLTPPIGISLFIASYRFERSIAEIYLSTLPFFLLLLCSVLIIAFWPWLSLFLFN